jgi:hypothetical protein
MGSNAIWTTRTLAEEAAHRGKALSQERVRQLCAAGVIEAERPARDWIIARQEGERWLNEYLGKE